MSISMDIIVQTILGLPSHDELVKLCDNHFIEQFKINRCGTSHYVYRLPRCSNTSTPLALIKFGGKVTLGKAHTQAYVFHLLKHDSNSPFKVPEVYNAWEECSEGYIVMKYVPSQEVTVADISCIVDTVQWLLMLPPPKDGRLGPVRGGVMHHSLWQYDEGPIMQDLLQHHS
ncbi:hypothetical protein C0995_008417 [Termitomyces sp. Mi166|nr:hypothetical protein C0995_008417 [Termitomyces sp. Mi166\